MTNSKDEKLVLRQKNFEALAHYSHSQTALAGRLKQREAIEPDLTQPVISAILDPDKTRKLSEREARYIEKRFGIPEGGLDRYPLYEKMELLRGFLALKLDDEAKKILHTLFKL